MMEVVSCYHWLLCLYFAFLQPDGYLKPEVFQFSYKSDSLDIRAVKQALLEYDTGFTEQCPDQPAGKTAPKQCSQQAERRLRSWLDRQSAACTFMTRQFEGSTSLSQDCQSVADALHRSIVRYRETVR